MNKVRFVVPGSLSLLLGFLLFTTPAFAQTNQPKAMPTRGQWKNKIMAHNQLNPLIRGNGQPVVGGSVSSLNGSSFNITNASNASFTIDASNAKVVKENATSSVAAISVGDRVLIQGQVNGSQIAASTVIDQGAVPAQTSSSSPNGFPRSMGFFGRIGGFFHRLFGFF